MEGFSIFSAPRLLTIPLSEMLRPALSESGKIEIPVSGSTAFTNFKYVQGVPAAAGEGIPVSRLQILDSIISNLISLRDRRSVESAPQDPSTLNDQQLDAVIKDMAKKLQLASTVIPAGIPAPINDSFGIATSQTGTAISLSA